MDSLFDAHTGVIIPVFTTAYGLLFDKDRMEARGQTRLKHHEKGRKTSGIFVFTSKTFGKYPVFWKVPGLLESTQTFGKFRFQVLFQLPSLTYDPISQGNNLN